MNNITQILRRWKNKSLYSHIGILGLGIALSISILTFTYFQYEFKYDNHISNKEKVFLVHIEGGSLMTSTSLGSTLQADIPGISGVGLLDYSETTFYPETNTEKTLTTRTINISSDFFSVFDLPVVHGSIPDTIRPNDIFITENCALNFFGTTDVVDQILVNKVIQSEVYTDQYTIRAVLKNIPENASIQGEAFRNGQYQTNSSYAYGKPSLLTYTWIRLENNVSIEQVESQTPTFLIQKGFPDNSTINFTALSSLHFQENPEFQKIFRAVSPKLAIILGTIAFLILLIAGINYINLSIAKSVDYIKEIGVRRTLGASNIQISRQFLADTVLDFIIALPLAYLLSWGLQPFFFGFLSIDINPYQIFKLEVLTLILLVSLCLSMPCGLYPVYMLLRKKTNQLLHHKKESFGINFSVRKTLIVFQYSISVVLIILCIGIYRQTNLLQNRPIGFEKNHLIMLPKASLRNNYQVFKRELLDINTIQNVTSSNLEIGKINSQKDTAQHIDGIVSDFDFVSTLGIKIIEGNNFDINNTQHRKYNSDYMIIEEGKEEEFRLKQEARPIIISKDLVDSYAISSPIGKIFKDTKGATVGTIIGVIEPFETGTQRQLNSQKILYGDPEPFYAGYVYIKISNKNIPHTIKEIEKVWKKHLSHEEFNYAFIDEKIDNMYKSEQGLTWMIISFTIISCVLSMIGVLSLLSLTLKQRTQEIGIRKVLGATISSISTLIAKDAVKPILASLLLAFPIAWWSINKWLEDFAYKMEITWKLFALSGGIIVIITLIAISFQTIKAAIANPVDSLRDE